MPAKIRDDYEVYVVPKGSAMIIGPVTFQELMENVLEPCDFFEAGDTTSDAPSAQASLPLFDRKPEEQADTGTSETSADRTSTYGGL